MDDNLATQAPQTAQQMGLSSSQIANIGNGISQPQFAAATAVPPPNQTIDANAVNNQQTTPSFQFPQAAPDHGAIATNANATNTSIPSTIPSAEQILNQGNQQTPAEATNQGLLSKLATFMQGKQSLATLQTNAETAGGVPGLTKTVNDLNSQLQGLEAQSQTLQLNAGAGGTIQNQAQNDAEGRGVTTQGLNAYTEPELRKNQIQQASVAAQSLTLKAAIYAAQGNLSLAKDAADKAGQVQFDAETQQIDYANSLIAANKDQMTKEEKNQADLVQAQLADRTQAIANAKQDKTTAVGLAVSAMKNNPNDPQAQYAAQQALKMNPDDPNYLTNVSNLIGKYQTDPLAVQKQIYDLQTSRVQAQYAAKNAQADYDLKQAQIKQVGTQKQDTLEQQFRTTLEKEFSARSGSLGNQSAKVDQAIHLRTLLDQYKDANGNFNVPQSQYEELAIGLANLVSGQTAATQSIIDGVKQKTAKGDIAGAVAYITGTTPAASTQAVFKNLSDSIDRQGTVADQIRNQDIKRLEGLAPTGLNNDRKQALLNDQFPSYQEAMQGKYSGQSQGQAVQAGGKSFNVGQVYQDASGAKWTVDASGKWTKQ